jgi:hypothetical protein
MGWEMRRFHETIQDAKQGLLDEQKQALAKNERDRVRQPLWSSQVEDAPLKTVKRPVSAIPEQRGSRSLQARPT